jgi:hypothetical protein
MPTGLMMLVTGATLPFSPSESSTTVVTFAVPLQAAVGVVILPVVGLV